MAHFYHKAQSRHLSIYFFKKMLLCGLLGLVCVCIKKQLRIRIHALEMLKSLVMLTKFESFPTRSMIQNSYYRNPQFEITKTLIVTH